MFLFIVFIHRSPFTSNMFVTADTLVTKNTNFITDRKVDGPGRNEVVICVKKYLNHFHTFNIQIAQLFLAFQTDT